MAKKRLFQILGYAAFCVLALLSSLYFTFPAQAVGQRLAHELNKHAGGTWAFSFDSVSLYRLTGVEAEGVTVRRVGDPLSVKVDAVRARLRVLPLFLLRLSVDAEVQLGEGVIDARVERKGANRFALDIDAESIDLTTPPLLSQFGGMPLAGEAVLAFEGELSPAMRASEGSATLAIAGATVGPGTVAGFTIPSVALGDLELAVALSAGKLEIASFEQQGGDVNAKLSGTSAIRAQASASTLDACVQFKAEESFLSKNPKLKAAIQLAEVRLRKDRDGFLHVPLSGTMARPRLRGGLCRKRSGATRGAARGLRRSPSRP